MPAMVIWVIAVVIMVVGSVGEVLQELKCRDCLPSVASPRHSYTDPLSQSCFKDSCSHVGTGLGTLLGAHLHHRVSTVRRTV